MTPVIAWGLLVAVGLLAVIFACSQARTALRRRARRQHYREAANQQRRATTQPLATGSISPAQVASISQDAQQAAWRVARNVEPDATNPHPARTRAFVLWEATFHSALSDFSELSEDPQPAAAKHDVEH